MNADRPGLPSRSFRITGMAIALAATACLGDAGPAVSANPPAPGVSRTFAIEKAPQTITFAALANKKVGDPDFTLHASASSGLAVRFVARGPCTLGGPRVHLTGVGICTITASQPGNANYDPAPPIARSFSIARRTVAVRCTVPNLVGKSLARAKTLLAQRHCRIGLVTRAYSRRLRKGVVIRQSPRPGRVIPANARVNLVASRGRR
jgi:hypothetical protein